MTNKKSTTIKKRNWAFVLYPESAPENWKEILQFKGLQSAISPLHDKDINPTGEPKKPHYHIILAYSGPTSYNVVKRLTDELNQPIPQALEQIKGYYRYLTHKDNPEKHQYSDKDIIKLNGFSILDYSEMTKTEINKIKKQLTNMIKQEKIKEYCDFIDLLMDEDEQLFEVGCNNTYFFNNYICSVRNKKLKIDTETGEVLE